MHKFEINEINKAAFDSFSNFLENISTDKIKASEIIDESLALTQYYRIFQSLKITELPSDLKRFKEWFMTHQAADALFRALQEKSNA